jgi:hypothetical protein
VLIITFSWGFPTSFLVSTTHQRNSNQGAAVRSGDPAAAAISAGTAVERRRRRMARGCSGASKRRQPRLTMVGPQEEWGRVEVVDTSQTYL